MIHIRNISLHAGRFTILKEINLLVNNGEYLVILGPTGAGKTVLLECIAGLHKIKVGEVWIDDRDITPLTPEERGIGYVPQDYILFPFLNVRQNIIFGLRQNKYSKIEIQERVNTLSHMLNISHILERDTHSLSGGEKQRVCIARALALSPKILLLDEPLSSLDLQTSKHLRQELKRIHNELGVTTIHVTHNQSEAEEIADRIAIISHGKLEQVDKPHEIFFSPKNEVVSNFVGALNIMQCDSCRTLGSGLTEVNCRGMRIVLPLEDDQVRKIAVSPRDIYISDMLPPRPSLNHYKGIITNTSVSGNMAKVEIQVASNSIKAEISVELFNEMNLSAGKEIFVILKLKALKILSNNDI